MSFTSNETKFGNEIKSVAALEKQLIPSKGKVTSVFPDTTLEVKNNNEDEGYACHRIRPLFKSEKSLDDELIQQFRDASSSLKCSGADSDKILKTLPNNGKKNYRKKSKDDVKVADGSSDAEKNVSTKSSSLRNFANIVGAHLNVSLTNSTGAAAASTLKASSEISSEEKRNCSKGSASAGSGLFSVVQEACAKHNVKWPVECQVVSPAVHHIVDWPLYPEPFYRATGSELRPQPVGDETGRLVYNYNPTSAVNYFSRSCVGGNKHVSDEVRPPLTSEDDSTLQFESRFESGNLAKVVQVSECYYELHIRSDLYTARHTQWYYFAISNTRKKMTYRFSIVNMMKCDSLYNHGLRPLLYSEKEAQAHGVGWRRCATNVVYFRNQDRYDPGCLDSDDDGEDDAASYTLTFNVSFPHDHDTVYLAHCYPYTFSLLQQHLLSIQNDPAKASICRQRVMCRSLAGNPVHLLTITSNHPEDEGKKKRAIVLTARVHPGETPASWIMKGALDFLTSDNPRAVDLRRQFVFKIVPMINPDGVIVGNHRCSLAARDLNRQYKMVVKEMFPAVWNIKAMVRKLMDEHGVVMYCDFHAHSRKHNTFLYGCENRRSHENHLREQIFPLLLHYNAGDKFSFRGCKFRVHRSKEGTARIVVWMMGVLHSYTLEASFGGATHGTRAQTHFTLHDFTTLGRQFCETLHTYFDPLPVKEKLRHKLWARLVKKGSNADEPTAVDLSDSNSSSDDSDKAATSSSTALGRSKKKKGGAAGASNAKVSARKRVGYKGSCSAVEKLGRQVKADKVCLSPSHYDDPASINTLTRHLSSSSTDVPKTYVYDPNTLTLVRRSFNRHSTGSLDLVDQSPSGATKHFLAHDSNSGELVGETAVGKTRSSSLRVKKSKTSRKARPSSSRNRQKCDGSPKFEGAGSPRVLSPTVLSAPAGSGNSPRILGCEYPTSIRIQSPNFSRRTVVTASLIQPAHLPHSPESIGAVGCSDYRRASQTKTYMERMSEMNARLAISDQEDENVRFWDADSRHSSPHHQEGLKKSTPSPRTASLSRMGGDREAIGPIVGKNLLNDPRKAQFNPSRRTITSTVKSPRRMLHRSLTNLCPPAAAPRVAISPPRSVPPHFSTHRVSGQGRPTANHKNQLCLSGVEENCSTLNKEEMNLNSTFKPTGSWLPSVLLDRGESEKMALFVDTKLANHKGDVPIYHSTGNLLNLDYVDPHPAVHRRVNKLIEASTYVSSPGNESSSSDSGYKSKQCDQHKAKKIGKSPDSGWKEDDSLLCADIETCDTLFLDIGGTKEPPELKAARNLKDRVKKKKNSKEQLLEETSADRNTSSATTSFSPNKLQPVDDVSVVVEKSSETDESVVKVKKKIKIVIGRKPKPKLLRKKSLADQAT